MQIDIPVSAQQRLADQATAHGFPTVDEFVGELLCKVASLSEQASIFAPLDDEQLAQSEDVIRRGEEDLAAGRTQEFRQGMLNLGASRGLTAHGK